jgi:hypothetical protein
MKLIERIEFLESLLVNVTLRCSILEMKFEMIERNDENSNDEYIEEKKKKKKLIKKNNRKDADDDSLISE